MSLKRQTEELNQLLESSMLVTTELKTIVLAPNVDSSRIINKYPEIKFVEEEFRSKEDAEDWLMYYAKVGQLYAMKFGYSEKWLIGGLTEVDSVNETIINHNSTSGEKAKQLAETLKNNAIENNIELNITENADKIVCTLYTKNVITDIFIHQSGHIAVRLRVREDLFNTYALDSFMIIMRDFKAVFDIIDKTFKPE